ncbi:MAG: NAD(P)/FAD-dependent oxidoreductase [Marinifilaceae bacterium]|jgi:pyruvate/2-oxoglutarate dehydrogenase complex dihydrolipoamide dehydrogenase (E3) component|nr:NAD(P)/FAD-dependent oxidoreductase [Marinifilaceae bacterium]
MKYDYDLACIGLGPAGMAVSIMGVEMGLKVCAIEKNKVGGECMNIGCIPSKSILTIGHLRAATNKLREMGLTDSEPPIVESPFAKIQSYLNYISDKKTMKMFDKVDLILGEGHAEFKDSHSLQVGDKIVTAKRIFIATGTNPAMPPIKGLDTIDNILTNENIFSLDQIPKSMTIIGGGAIGTEMAQAFTNLGTKCSIVQFDDFLIPNGDREAGELLERELRKEGIDIYNKQRISSVEQKEGEIILKTESGLELVAEKLLVAAGRKINLNQLKLENAKIKHDGRRILVDKKFRTSTKNIYAVGDCNGQIMLSHAAMHQGMFAIMNAVSPFRLFKNTNYVIPWTVFTTPQVSYVGMSERELKEKKIKYQTIVQKYEDYGAAIAENLAVGFIKVFVSSRGKVYGVSIIGDGSGEMINEWAVIIQNNIPMHKVMFVAHSFPTMGFLSKRVAEEWMMKKMKSKSLQSLCKFMYRKL